MNSLIAIVFGLCLGCSAPGIGLWLTAWICLAPLLFIIRIEQTDKNHPYKALLKVFLYGFLFGLAYNCVYLQWYLGLAPLDWLGFNAWQGQLLAWAALLIVAGHQALLIALFALCYRLSLNALQRFSLLSNSQIAGLIHILLVPLLWILITNKMGNAHDLTGVPWSMLEYTQYKQLYLIQIADIVGGIGICFLIVMVNTLFAQIAFSIFTQLSMYKAKADDKLRSVGGDFKFKIIGPNFTTMFAYFETAFNANLPAIVICFFLLLAALAYSGHCLASDADEPVRTISIMQPNINIEMEKTKRKYTLTELLTYQMKLSSQCPRGLCVWTEGAVPACMPDNPAVQSILKEFAQKKRLSLIVGTIDKDNDGNAYNAAWGVSSHGEISRQIYHKRYLVPFGEYTPAWVRNWPEWILRLTNTPAGGGYSSGTKPALINIDDKLIAPLICFEVISPELAATGVRAGGQLLVNINDLAWFHQSIIGEQMIACAVLRAVENRRYCIFAANTGPSAVISPFGKIKSYLAQNKAGHLIDQFNYSSKLSLFTQWFVF